MSERRVGGGHRRPGSGGFERWAWFFMRISGVALLGLAVFHLLWMHFAIGVDNIDFQTVVERWSNPLWRLYDFALLAFALGHGLNGLRTVIDDELMREVAEVRDAAKPAETLLVCDAMTGQDAVTTAERFRDEVGLTGVVLTRVDGDARGGAALSMRAVTGKPIKFVGLGEKMDALETFEPERIAGRILGMGDIVSLVEKAQETIEAEQAERMMKRFQKGQFNMNDLKSQLEQMQKMGGMDGVMGMMPGMGKYKKQMEASGFDDSVLTHQIALIQSMTKKERANPQLLQASRKRRIAGGAGLEVSDLNKLIKQHRQMADMMKKMGKMGQKGMMRQLGGMFGGNAPSQADLAAAQSQMRGGMPGMGSGGQQLPSSLSGFGRKK